MDSKTIGFVFVVIVSAVAIILKRISNNLIIRKFIYYEYNKAFMDSLITFALQKKYESIEKLGDPLADIGTLFNWERFRPLLGDMYNNKSEEGGRPNFDEILMIKALVLAQWYGLTDKALEREISDKVSFMNL
jgi:hypothetical protein